MELYKNTLAAIGISLAVAASSDARADQPGTVHSDWTMESEHLSWDLNYTIYFPPGYAGNDRKYPVIYLMQGGADHTHNYWFHYGRAARVFDDAINAGEVPPFIAVAPDARRLNDLDYNTYYMNDADGAERWEDMFVKEFVPHIEEIYPVIAGAGNRAIVGLSMGGYAALYYALKYPEMFAAAAALSPAIRTDEQIASMDQTGYDRRYGKAWGMGLEGEDRLTEAYYAYSVFEQIENASNEAIAGTRLYIDTGADDVFFEGSVKLHAMLRSEGSTERTLRSDHRFMIREGGHDWEYWRTGLPGALRFVGGVLEQ